MNLRLFLGLTLFSSNVAAQMTAPQYLVSKANFDIEGAGFVVGGTYKANLSSRPAGVIIAPISVSTVTPTKLTFPLGDVAPGLYDLSIALGANTLVPTFVAEVVAPQNPRISKQPELPEIGTSQQVTIHGENFRAGPYSVNLRTGTEQNGQKLNLEATAARDHKSLSFKLDPKQVAVGRYTVTVASGGIEYPVPGDLRVIPDSSAPVKLDAVYPITIYPTDRTGFDFEIDGQNLGDSQANTTVLIDNRPIVFGTKADCDQVKDGKYKDPCLVIPRGMEGRTLKVYGYQPFKYTGEGMVQVRVGSNTSNSVPLVFARVTERGVLWAALVVFVAIMAIVMKLVWKGVGSSTVGRRRYSPWTSFFLDKVTNTYSLSKFQLLVWTSVFVFGYLYLFLCRMLIQWKFELPPVPDGMPGMLAISAGTAVAAAGATESRGSKGSGGIHPSAADFVSTGGLVVGERFQFFIWTLVGAFGFLSLLLLTNPAKLLELPKIPDNFLYVMGISSVGYLAGKVTRKPGPVIRTISVLNVTPPSSPATMKLKLIGENLSTKATIKIGDKALIEGKYHIIESKPQDQAPDPSFSTEFILVLDEADDYIEGVHTVTMTNPDGQAASAEFPTDPLSIDNATVDGRTVKVTGKNFAEGITATWKSGDKKFPAGKVVFDKDKPGELTVQLLANISGEGTLILESAIHLRATTKLKIG